MAVREEKGFAKFFLKQKRNLTVLMDTMRGILHSKKPRGVQDMEFEFVWVRGHVEVYDAVGRFCFSADNMREAREELEEIA